MKKFHIDIAYLIVLITIAVISHVQWFNPNSILAYGDWMFWYRETMQEYIHSYGAWWGSVNLGVVNIQIYFNIFTSFWSILANIGIETFQAYKINLFIPIAIFGFISPYFFAKQLVDDRFIAFVAALFYGSTTYFLLSQTSHLPIAFVYSIAPFIFLSFIYTTNHNTTKSWLLFSLLYSIGVGYEVRIMFIVTVILAAYFLYFYRTKIRKYLRNILLSALVILGLNCYWILPTIFGGASSSISEVANRGLFGDHLASLTRGFTLYHWAWTGGFPDENFNPQSIKIQFWILPIFVLSMFVFSKKSYTKIILFYLFLLLVGIFFVKQSSPPFKEFYSIFYNYIPGFNLFRESSKYNIIVALSYTALLSYGLVFLKQRSYRLYYIVSLLFIGIFLLNLKPLITQEYRTVFVSRDIPKEYIEFKDFIISEDRDYRVLWVPRESMWSYSSNHNPKVNMVGVTGINWKEYMNRSDKDMTEGRVLINFFKDRSADNILDLSSIRYVVLPIVDSSDLEKRLYEFYGEDRKTYMSELNKLSYLERFTLPQSKLVIYENKDYRPRVYYTFEKESVSKNIPFEEADYSMVDATHYDIHINNLTRPIYLQFSESYNPNWKLHLGDFSIIESVIKPQYFLNASQHFKNDAQLNSYYINPKEVCTTNNCTINNDQSYNMKLTLYYLPQRYLYIGTVITFIALILVIIGLFIKKK